MRFSTFGELVDVICEILPNATFGDDNDGQLIIYTNLHISNDDSLDNMDSTDSVDSALTAIEEKEI